MTMLLDVTIRTLMSKLIGNSRALKLSNLWKKRAGKMLSASSEHHLPRGPVHHGIAVPRVIHEAARLSEESSTRTENKMANIVRSNFEDERRRHAVLRVGRVRCDVDSLRGDYRSSTST